MSHPPYSPDLTPSDFFSVSPDEKVLKGKHFAHLEEVEQKKWQKHKEASKLTSKNCSEQWKITS